jgi:hypothetical protein
VSFVARDLTMTRRPAVTLIEVLVAIFVVAIGLLALLTLFPLGALSMAQAIRDDRVALMASNAVATLRTWDVASDPLVLDALTHNNQANFPADGPTFAAFFDPVGFNSYAGAAGGQVGSVPGISRCSSTRLQGYPGANRSAFIQAWFTSLDDLTFTCDVSPLSNRLGVPADGQGREAAVSSAPVQRDGRYSWGAMLRRPLWGQPVTEVSVVVYTGRSTSLSPTFGPAGETPLPVTAVNGAVLRVAYAGAAPDIRPGGWVLDATDQPGHGTFYRVTGVTPAGNNGIDLELQTPLRTPACSQVIVMDNVAEVIEKGVIGP